MENFEQQQEYGHVLTVEERRHLACKDVVGDYETCVAELEGRLREEPVFRSWNARDYAA